MTIEIPSLSPEAQRATLIGAAKITLASILGSELLTLLVSLVFNIHADTPAFLVAGLVPLLFAGPGSYLQLKRLAQLRAAYGELERVASTDYLTGCLNRRAFTFLASAASEKGPRGALILIDADGFKSINDRFGHDRGDEALRAIATVIRRHARPGDLVGRLGGEEFGVYLPDATIRQATDLAEAIREAVEDVAFAPQSHPHALSVSVGIATVRGPLTYARLFRAADEQLYVAKENGRNRVAITAVVDIDADRAAA